MYKRQSKTIIRKGIRMKKLLLVALIASSVAEAASASETTTWGNIKASASKLYASAKTKADEGFSFVKSNKKDLGVAAVAGLGAGIVETYGIYKLFVEKQNEEILDDATTNVEDAVNDQTFLSWLGTKTGMSVLAALSIGSGAAVFYNKDEIVSKAQLLFNKKAKEPVANGEKVALVSETNNNAKSSLDQQSAPVVNNAQQVEEQVQEQVKEQQQPKN